MKTINNRKRLIAKRNQKILERFEYWHEKKLIRYDDVISILSEEEFFLTTKTIMDILRDTKKEQQEKEKQKPKQLKLKIK